MGCGCGGAAAAPVGASGSPVARWQVKRPNGQVVLYMNEEQAKREATRFGVTAAPYSAPPPAGAQDA